MSSWVPCEADVEKSKRRDEGQKRAKGHPKTCGDQIYHMPPMAPCDQQTQPGTKQCLLPLVPVSRGHLLGNVNVRILQKVPTRTTILAEGKARLILYKSTKGPRPPDDQNKADYLRRTAKTHHKPVGTYIYMDNQAWREHTYIYNRSLGHIPSTLFPTKISS